MSQATAEQAATTPAAKAPVHFSANHRELTDALSPLPSRPGRPSRPWAASWPTPRAAA